MIASLGLVMLIYFQSLEQFRESFPMLPLALIGIGFLAMLWLLRHTKKRRKAKSPSVKRLEDRHAAAIRKIGSIKMNQWMDKRINALLIMRRESPTAPEILASLKLVTAFQGQASARANSRTDKTGQKGVS